MLCLLLVGCNGESDALSLDWGGAESQFEATVEGTLGGTFSGQAHFRTNADGHLVGIELMHGSDSARGVSIELEPRALAARTYEAIPSNLIDVDRPGAPAGLVAFYEDGRRSFTAVRGSLVVRSAEAAVVEGDFTLEMDSREGLDQPAQDDLTLSGSFTATPLADS